MSELQKKLEQLQAENAELKKELAEIKLPKTKGDDDSVTFNAAAFIRWEARHKDTLKENAELKAKLENANTLTPEINNRVHAWYQVRKKIKDNTNFSFAEIKDLVKMVLRHKEAAQVGGK